MVTPRCRPITYEAGSLGNYGNGQHHRGKPQQLRVRGNAVLRVRLGIVCRYACRHTAPFTPISAQPTATTPAAAATRSPDAPIAWNAIDTHSAGNGRSTGRSTHCTWLSVPSSGRACTMRAATSRAAARTTDCSECCRMSVSNTRARRAPRSVDAAALTSRDHLAGEMRMANRSANLVRSVASTDVSPAGGWSSASVPRARKVMHLQ